MYGLTISGVEAIKTLEALCNQLELHYCTVISLADMLKVHNMY